MDAILSGDEELHITTGGQDWIVTWHAPPVPPPGTPHGAAGICVTSDGDIVLISADGGNWDFPAGRPEANETWEQTLRREMQEEACAEVLNARLLGFARSRCVAGHEKGHVIVRSFWRTEVTLGEWKPEWEITHRRVVPVRDVLRYVPTVYLPVSRRALREAGLFRAGQLRTNQTLTQRTGILGNARSRAETNAMNPNTTTEQNAPALPDFPFDRYIKYDELTRLLHQATDARPDLVKLESIGKSYEGRDIWCATVTDFSTGPDSEKPAVYADANIHATEVSPTTAVTYLLHKLLAGYGSDEKITRALKTRAFYLIPRVNPDGAELYLSDTPRYLRSSTRPYPFDEEPLDGLKREDINGDGLSLQMRIPDKNGPWKKYGDDGRIMVRRDPVETGGDYFRLLPEGRLTNYDGVTFSMQRNKEGLDLNRNFPAHWRPENEQGGAGPYPTSEPEARALVAFITSHKNICHAVTFHTYSGVLLRPYGTQADDGFPAEDLWTYQAIGKKGTEFTGYPAVSVFHDFKYHPKEVITGVFDDWCYDHLGIFAWTTEIWSPQRQAGITKGFDAETSPGSFKFTTWGRDHDVSDDVKLVQWADSHLDGKGYYDWKPFDHPELGPVEIGGWDALYAFRNPPPPMLQNEIAPHSDWLIWQSLTCPHLSIHTAEATKLSEGVYKIRLVVQNEGWLPSYVTKKANERKAVRPVIAEITLPDGATLQTGKPREELGQLEGWAYKPVANSGYSADATDDRAKREWIVSAPTGGTVSLVVKHERAGTVRVGLELGEN